MLIKDAGPYAEPAHEYESLAELRPA
jgi:hypothetical protein